MTDDNLPHSERNDHPHPPADGNIELLILVGVMIAVASTLIIIATLGLVAQLNSWERFWPNAGQPFATVIGGLAVLGGGTLALYNGRKTRDNDTAISQTENTRDRELADIAHRRETEKELNARFITAASQLGADSTAIRRAGAYALAALADDWSRQGNSRQHQVCVDVLCGYLANKPSTSPGAPPDPVKRTIQQIIAKNVGQTATTDGVTALADTNWHTANYDFTEAILHDVNFSRCHFAGNVTFERAQITGATANFIDTRFEGATLQFADAVFAVDNVYFSNCTFAAGWTTFTNAEFRATQMTDFSAATFKGGVVLFHNSNFNSHDTTFYGAQFDCSNMLSFAGARFAGVITFIDATWKRGRTAFHRATFDVKNANFSGMTIEPNATLDFTNPHVWDDSRMSFDWSGLSADDMPANIRPKNWPPQQTAPTNT